MNDIHDIKPAKSTMANKPRYRFGLAVDIRGRTVISAGWLYYPEAKQGYRVWPPKQGYARTLLGVTRELLRDIERDMEKKLERLEGGLSPKAAWVEGDDDSLPIVETDMWDEEEENDG